MLAVSILQRAAVGHRIACVHGEVDQDLLHLSRIDQHRAQIGGQRAVQLDMLPERAAQQLLDVADDVVDVDDLRLHDLAAGEREQLVGQVRGPLGGQADLLDVRVDGPPAILQCRRRAPDRR